MYLGVSSPIVEVFVKGSVPRDVRLLAARGMAASVGCDRLALLALMTLDEDPEVSALASATIDAIPRQALSAFFGRDDVPQELRAWFETRRGAVPPTSEAADTPDGAASAARRGRRARDAGVGRRERRACRRSSTSRCRTTRTRRTSC